MKFYIKMPLEIIPYFEKEIIEYYICLENGSLDKAWYHLERAHIIGQKYPYEHSLVHWKMLLFGIKIKSLKEIIGQLPRLLVGGIKSFVGHVPLGNTGGSNVPPLKPMNVPPDIETILKLNS
ncbi:MAG: hypothetical protein ACJAYP_001362 [Flavobacterium sp.]|jgi:hypothetical protein